MRDRSSHAVLLIATIVRIALRRGIDDGAIAMLVWNGLALVRLWRIDRIPRAVAVRGAGRRHWRSLLTRHLVLPSGPEPDAIDIAQWRPLEPYVLESRPWT